MIVGISGGLGNQMFKYAFGISVGKARKEPVFFHKRYGPSFDMRHGRKFMLDAFIISGEFIDDPGDAPGFDKSEGFNSDVYTAPNGLYFEGSWQSEKYFDVPTVVKEFTLKDPIGYRAQQIYDEINRSRSSIFLHVRRGDFLWASEIFQGLQPLEYYKRAMSYIKERVVNAKFFVFSDDYDWCSATFSEVKIVAPNKSHEDLWLMSQCKHAILANSTFSWWGAWLGDREIQNFERIVIAPVKWYADPNKSIVDLIPKRWIQQ